MLEAALILFAQELFAPPPEQPVELGGIRWERDYAAARERAQKEAKPLLVLFQEVPG